MAYNHIQGVKLSGRDVHDRTALLACSTYRLSRPTLLIMLCGGQEHVKIVRGRNHRECHGMIRLGRPYTAAPICGHFLRVSVCHTCHTVTARPAKWRNPPMAIG